MKRNEFSVKIAGLIVLMFCEGEEPIIDWTKRSKEEQRRLFNAGLSKCDGVEKVSGHQRGTAMDIYFEYSDDSDLQLDPPRKGWEYWHKIWEGMGGKPMIEWDKGHFEG